MDLEPQFLSINLELIKDIFNFLGFQELDKICSSWNLESRLGIFVFLGIGPLILHKPVSSLILFK